MKILNWYNCMLSKLMFKFDLNDVKNAILKEKKSFPNVMKKILWTSFLYCFSNTFFNCFKILEILLFYLAITWIAETFQLCPIISNFKSWNKCTFDYTYNIKLFKFDLFYKQKFFARKFDITSFWESLFKIKLGAKNKF